MRSLFAAGIFLLLPALASSAQTTQGTQKTMGNSCGTLSANFLQNLQKGDFAAATTHFDKNIMTGFDAKKLKGLWQQSLPQMVGAFQYAAKPKEAPYKSGLEDVLTPLKFTDYWMDMIVTCNRNNQIVGLHFQTGPAPDATQKTAGVGAQTLPLTVQRKGFVLKGVLDLPAGKGPFPVVDIIPGSGPTDLNGNSIGLAGGIAYSPYKKLAAALVKAGWAVARVAKRGLPPSTGDGNNVVFADQVADNLAVVEALRKNPHINPNRIVVLGHSIGGLIAPKLATETRLAGLILLEAPGESMKKITTAQVMEMNQQAGASATQLTAIKKVQEAFYQKVAQTPAGKSLSYAGKEYPAWNVQLFKSWYAQKPLATARRVTIPTLVVQGGMDFSTPPGNGKRLVQALPQGTLLYLPKMGHALDVAPCQCLQQIHTGTDATLDPRLATGIVRWLRMLKP